MMNNKKSSKTKPRGRPQVSTLKRLTKSVTVKFSKPDYEMLRRRSKNANRTLAEYIRDSAFDARGKSSVSCPLKPSDSAPLC